MIRPISSRGMPGHPPTRSFITAACDIVRGALASRLNGRLYDVQHSAGIVEIGGTEFIVLVVPTSMSWAVWGPGDEPPTIGDGAAK